MSTFQTLEVLALAGLAGPALLLAVLGVASLVKRPLPERWTGPIAGGVMTVAFTSFAAALLVSLLTRANATMTSIGAWSTTYPGGIAIEFLLDRLSLDFAVLSTGIAGVVAAFSNRYLHREPGYNRYFVLFSMFVTGMLLVALAGNIEVLFAGWEFVGLSSALLVAFFHERAAPVSNALRVFSVYRISDAAMLAAAVLLHHAAGSGSLSLLFGDARAASLSGVAATEIAVLLVVAVAGKSALFPFSGWLPRAMEGPTPSSAVYYGSLSIHAGCYLLLRSLPLLELSLTARVLAGGLGAITAILATLSTRAQSDIKSSLAYASLTQVGIIVIEIALGLRVLAFAHLTGHACFRLLQFLSAPNILHDLHALEIGPSHEPSPAPPATRRGALASRRLYLIALERGFLDTILDRVVVAPFLALTRRMALIDEALCSFVGGSPVPAIGQGEEHDD